MKKILIILITMALLLLATAPLLHSLQGDPVSQPPQFEYSNVAAKPEPQQLSSAQPAAILSEADRLTHEFRMTQERYKLYECLILSFCMFVCLLIALWALKQTSNFNAGNVLNATGLVLIVFGTIYVVVLSDTEQQMTATVGILGAIAGYLFGTMEKGRRPAEQHRAATQADQG